MLWAFGLIGISAAMLVAGLGLILGAGYALIIVGVQYLGTGFIVALVMLNTWAVNRFGGPAMRMAFAAAGRLWRPFLTYYKYEAHTLRPIRNEGGNVETMAVAVVRGDDER